jgi:hypothetical protein
MGFPIRIAATALLAAFVLLAAGCGETVIDDVKAEDAIHQDVEKALHEKIASVDCPSDQKVEAGKTFSCTIVFANGKRAEETLKIVNDDADVKPIGFKPIGGK